MRAERLRLVNDLPVRGDAQFVLLWMIAQRRTRWNHALDRALCWARALGKPLVVVEPLSLGYRWASERTHAFVIEGMADNRRALRAAGVGYHPYVEPRPGAARGLAAAWGARAAVAVIDDHPGSPLDAWATKLAAEHCTRVEAVDGCGLLPRRAAGRPFPTAHGFRRHLQREGVDPADLPAPDPLSSAPLVPAGALPAAITARWPVLAPDLDPRALVHDLPLDHGVGAVARVGGAVAADAALRRFLAQRVGRFGERGDPTDSAHSGLSPWLHFGHLAPQQVLIELGTRFDWTPADAAPGPSRGARVGWWGLPAPVEAFLDQLVTWRELAFNVATYRPDHATYEAQPDWARRTLAAHVRDPRPRLVDLSNLEDARSDDPIWNAAQRELRSTGSIHSYLRMLWGKRVLEWTATPRAAFATLVALNDRWALDGRDPISYASIGWVLGRHDRAWGPERPIFGKVRPMTSTSAARKLRLGAYLARYGPEAAEV